MSGIDWNLVRAFRATAEAGSLSAASRLLGLSQPTLSRQVAALEEQLAVTLFERVGKKLVLTAGGAVMLEHARQMAAAAEALALSAAGQASDLSGRVNLSVTDAVATHVMPGIVERLRREVPQVTIVVIATDAVSDLRRREADIAIRHIRPTEPELIGRLIGDLTARLYASDGWIERHGRPRAVSDLSGATFLAFDPVERFVEHMALQGFGFGLEQCSVVSNSASALWEMTRRGIGVGVVLDLAAARMSGLRALLPGLVSVPVPLWLVTHRELQTSRRIRLVYDILADELRRLVVSGADPSKTPEDAGRPV
ncbi:LysR family transcriptional regulator [Bosea sp. (in: a-proteobacteria)]|uniref:LysR family transcriptional regulator n=1 Tax=Bosea sp. (in: a-proteobacteria) TaxID=1871050 RepID=UPI002736CD71|nr:LysR family transcriptional regulator [Bosea sp. (in: a-proteobacteria)]MDP3254479.1 LysR family transcriptional regulator [Bosea sp. (in: a-proteobacteria)]